MVENAPLVALQQRDRSPFGPEHFPAGSIPPGTSESTLPQSLGAHPDQPCRSASPQQAPRHTPERIDRYHLLERLGEGSSGIVFRAFDTSSGAAVAVKVLRGRVEAGAGGAATVADPALMRARFWREAAAIRHLVHPNIAALRDFGEDDGERYLVLDLVEGVSLSDCLATGHAFQPAEAVCLMRQLLSALDFAHSAGIVHRDVKPSNLLLGHDGRLRLGDFGIARIDAWTLGRASAGVGTPGYMPPEQFLGRQVDHRADIYAAGVVLYHLLTGDRPFRGPLAGILHKVLNEPAAAPSMVNPRVPAALDAVIEKAMAKRPEDRYVDAAVFASALGRAAEAAGLQTVSRVAVPAAGGSDQPEASARSAGGPEGRPGQAARLICLTPDLLDDCRDMLGRPIPPAGEHVIGRDETASVVIPSRRLSRRHAVLTQDARGWLIRDLDSTNGLFVNGERVIRARLVEGDVVTFGRVAFRFTLDQADDAVDGATERVIADPPWRRVMDWLRAHHAA